MRRAASRSRLKQRVVGDPGGAPKQDWRTNAIGAPLPARLTLVHEVIDPIDQALKDIRPEERAIPVLGAERDVEAEMLREGVFGHPARMTKARDVSRASALA
jgi:hypothetical protein